MNGASHPNEPYWGHPNSAASFQERTRVNAQKNITKATYAYFPKQFDYVRHPFDNTHSSHYLPRYGPNYPQNYERSVMQTSQNQKEDSSVSYSYSDPPQLSIHQVAPPLGFTSDNAGVNRYFQEHYQPLQTERMNEIPVLSATNHVGITPQATLYQSHSGSYGHQHVYIHYDMTPSRSHEMKSISTQGREYLDRNRNQTNEFHHEPDSSEYLCYVAPSPATYPHTSNRQGLDNYDPVKQAENTTFPVQEIDQCQNILLQSKTSNCLVEKGKDDIQETAYNFVDVFCPLLGEKPYCIPPIKRLMHKDKQLVHGMESEKRVFGSFERFFAERQIPVFMLCHYPMFGFLQVYHGNTKHLDRLSMSSTGKHSNNTVTLLLLSHVFGVTIVTVSIISGNSDFAYIHRGVQKAVMHMKRCNATVTKILNLLEVRSEVKQVIAFPNLKRVILQRVMKEKLNFGSMTTLHVDELAAPFEEEWSTKLQKHLFSDWIQDHVLCHSPTLTKGELHLVVGAMLSPRLSKVEFVDNLKIVTPIPESINSTSTSDNTKKEVGQLKLTIDGVTKPFDEFMDEYVKCYYPNIEEQTYRVPPIHFNIQSFKSSREYLYAIKEDPPVQKEPMSMEPLDKTNEKHVSGFSSKENRSIDCENYQGEIDPGFGQFMPPARSFTMSARRNDNYSDQPSSLKLEKIKNSYISDKHVINSDKTVEIPFIYTRDSINNTQDSLYKKDISDSQSVAQFIPNASSRKLISSEQSSTITTSLPQTTESSSESNIRKLSHTALSLNSLKQNASAESLQDVEVLTEAMAKDVRADEGENRVISALEFLGHHRQFKPMFIICDYQYNNYLNKLREEMFSKEEASRPIRAFGQTMRAEHDCLIFHKKYGAVIVCIKAVGDNFAEWGATEEQQVVCTKKILEKAVKQLEREEAMIRHVTSDLCANLVCHKLIALPNLTRENVEKALKTSDKLTKKIEKILGHGLERFLCYNELPPKHETVWDYKNPSLSEKLVNWWQNVLKLFSEDKRGEISSKLYRQLIGRYCGLLSTVEVWSATNPRVEVRSASEAISVCAQRFCKMILLPHQIEALCSTDRHVFLYGPPGSGKTLVLILKAREWLLAGETVFLINSRPGSIEGFPYAYGVFKRLQQMMMESKVQSYKLYMIRTDSLKFKADDLAGVMPSSCIIMDEVTPSFHEIIEHLACLQVKNIWCAGVFQDDRPITAHRFSSHKMDKILRCPPIVQSLLKHTEEAVRMKTPYKDNYQSSVLVRKHIITRFESCFKKHKITKEINDLQKQNMESETNVDTNVDSELLNKRLEEKYGSGQTQKLVEFQNTSQLNVYFRHQYSAIRPYLQIRFDGNQDNTGNEHQNVKNEICYDSESLNKRLTEKYSSNPLVPKQSQETREEDVKTTEVLSDEVLSSDKNNLNCVSSSESLNERLKKKYGIKPQLSQESHNPCPLETVEMLENSATQINCTSDIEQVLKLQSELIQNLENLYRVVSEKNEEVLSYDCDSLNKRLEEKYCGQCNINEKSQKTKQIDTIDPSIYSSSTMDISLATDGPRPHIIDHSSHLQPGNPTDCFECGQKLADFLKSMIRPEGVPVIRNLQNKKNHSPKITSYGKSQSGKTFDSVLFSNTSSIHTKLSALSVDQKFASLFDSRSLTWSDVLIVARDMPKDCAFVSALKGRNIPVEILMSGKTSEIENTKDRKLFITSYKEVTGIERALIVFVPSGCPERVEKNSSTTDIIDLQLAQSINHFIEDDKIALCCDRDEVSVQNSENIKKIHV